MGANGRSTSPPDPAESARTAGLRYATDDEPGLSIERTGDRLIVRDARGRMVRDRPTLDRVRKLVIPPAWRDVWVAADARAHLQATGRDAAGRKQYRYHSDWVAVRDATKYDRMAAFAKALPHMRRRVSRDLRQRPLSRPAVLATVVTLLERTNIRIGNEEYARQNGSHGLTTLRDRHVRVRGPRIRFDFRAKSGVRQTIDLADARLAAAVRRCQDLPGQILFQYLDEAGEVRSLTSSDVNAYLQEIAGGAFTAKDFRTWAGTLAAARALAELGPAESQKASRRTIVAAIDRVAQQLGNTRAVCRKCYIHPAVIEAYTAGRVLTLASSNGRRPRGLSAEEAALLGMLSRPPARPEAAFALIRRARRPTTHARAR
jgi:DNA topoisomerase-1